MNLTTRDEQKNTHTSSKLYTNQDNYKQKIEKQSPMFNLTAEEANDLKTYFLCCKVGKIYHVENIKLNEVKA